MLVKPHKDLDYLFHLDVDHVYFGWDFTEEDFKEMMITIKVKEFDPKYFYKQVIQ